MIKLKLVTLLILGCLALGTSSAMAAVPEFVSEKYPVVFNGKSSKPHGFRAVGVTLVCKEVQLAGEEVKKEGTSLVLHPIYIGCWSSIGEIPGILETTVKTTGCDYKLNAPPKEKERGGTMDIECEAGKEVVATFKGTKCEIKLGSQKGLKTMAYENEVAGGKKVIILQASLLNLSFTSAECPMIVPKASNMSVYAQGEIKENGAKEVIGVQVLGLPAPALVAGFEPVTNVQIGVEVSNI